MADRPMVGEIFITDKVSEGDPILDLLLEDFKISPGTYTLHEVDGGYTILRLFSEVNDG